MAQFTAYLTFNGNCSEAMNFYKECLGGELKMQTIGETPVAEHMPPEKHKNVMHSSLTNGNIMILASDMMEENYLHGNSISLCLICSSEEEIKSAFSKLSAGATITHELKTEFWGAMFGMLVDKYGFKWMFNFDVVPAKA